MPNARCWLSYLLTFPRRCSMNYLWPQMSRRHPAMRQQWSLWWMILFILFPGNFLKMFWLITMMSSNGDIFRITGHLCGEFTGHRWLPPHNGQWHRASMFYLLSAWTSCWTNNRVSGDLRHYNAAVTSTQWSLAGMAICGAYFIEEPSRGDNFHVRLYPASTIIWMLIHPQHWFRNIRESSLIISQICMLIVYVNWERFWESMTIVGICLFIYNHTGVIVKSRINLFSSIIYTGPL